MLNNNTIRKQYDCLVLFSRGLDSLLSALLLKEQGLRVLGIHFTSPFFGRPDLVPKMQREYGLDILAVDISQDYINLLTQGPKHGFGKNLNPCIDCKITMLKKAKEMLPVFQAKFIVSGEVLGQRPMSQRRDALNIIAREAEVKDILLRPLSALHLPPTPMEETGLVDRTGLLGIKGRGRKEQLHLARHFQLREIPTPAGGCLLTEPESVKRYLPLLKHLNPPKTDDFLLSNVGRQFWRNDLWLVIGRNQADNRRLQKLITSEDIILKLANLPGPIALGRQVHEQWTSADILDAASFFLNFCPKALGQKRPVRLRIGRAGHVQEIQVHPEEAQHKKTLWQEGDLADLPAIKAWLLQTKTT